MPRFLTIGYGDRAGYERTPPEVRDEAHEADARLKASGAVMGIAGTPVQVRNRVGVDLTVTEGPYASTPLPVAGFALIEAESLEAAIEIAGQSPCAVAHGVVEVWPLLDAPA